LHAATIPDPADDFSSSERSVFGTIGLELFWNFPTIGVVFERIAEGRFLIMMGIIGIIALLSVLGLSLVVTRIASAALTMTGLSQEAARFQARSAFTGSGFTTSESEKVVNHPVRRRIIMLLMILRSAGLVSIVISLILSFVGTEPDVTKLHRLLWLIGGVAVLWFIANAKFTDHYINRAVRWALTKWTRVDVRDYASLLRISGRYSITEIQVQKDDWIGGKKLRECRLRDEGLMILGIVRNDGAYIGAPRGDTEIFPGDRLITYGRDDALQDLDERRAGRGGDQSHEEAVSRHEIDKAEQDSDAKAYKRKRESEEVKAKEGDR
jgi:hypothetical protein